VYNHPKVKEFYPPKIASTIWFTAKEGELDKFTQVYTDNPFRVITSHKESPLYALGHTTTGAPMQGTFILWRNEKERDVAQSRPDLKTAIEAVKSCGLLSGPPAARNFPIQLEIRPSAKSVQGNAQVIHFLRVKLKEGKSEEFIKALHHHNSDYLRNPDHVVWYFGGVDAKENEFNGVCFYTSIESHNSVINCESRVKLINDLKPLLAGEIHTFVANLKHVHQN